ncbi:hypothetical protein O6H91_16G075100 [Diphasiastrum complanatum]|nr:hypothetical protein O6H91_16G075100 [Diphasiastrum complanatum]
MAWKSLVTTGQQPGFRDSHSAVLASNKVIIFGGTNGFQKINDVHILDISTQFWYHPTVQGKPPPPRESHTATLFGYDRIVVFGGSGDGDGNYLNDVHVLDLKNMEWSRPSVKGELPSCRDSHTSVVIGEQLIVYGGDCGDRYLGGVDILDLQTFKWSKLEISGSAQPGGRAGHTAVNVGNKMYVFGGVGDRAYFNDVWMLDVATRTWSAIDVAGPEPQGRFSHVAAAADNKIAIFGGCGEDERPLNELLLLCLEVDEVIEDAPLRKCRNRTGIGRRRDGRKDFRNTLEADQGYRINYLQEHDDSSSKKRVRRLLDLVGAHERRMCARKEVVYESPYKLKAESIARRPLNQAGYSSTPDGVNNCHLARRSTISSSAADLNIESKNAQQRRMRSRSVPLPFNAQAQDGPENHSEWKRRKTTKSQCKVEREDFQEEEDYSLFRHSLPVGKQANQIIHHMNQKMQYCIQQGRQHLEQPLLALHAFCTEQQSPKRTDVEKRQTVQRQSHLPANEAKPLCRQKGFQLLHFAQEQEVGNQDSSTKGVHRMDLKKSLSGEIGRPQSCSVMTTKKVPDLVGAEVQGMIDGAFETGYLMTAQMNGQVLRGVLFPHACSADDATAEVMTPSSDHHSHVALRASTALQTSCIARPSIIQTSSHKTVAGYPASRTVPFANDVYLAASSSPLCAVNDGPYVKTEARLAVSSCISCRTSMPCTVPRTAKPPVVASNVHSYQEPDETLQASPAESIETSPDLSLPDRAQKGFIPPDLSMLRTEPAALTGGRWVWQPSNPQSVPCNSRLCENTSDNFIQFVPLPQFKDSLHSSPC